MPTTISDDELFDGELDRVEGRTSSSDEGGDACCRARVRCAAPASAVLASARQVLGCVLRNRPSDWPDNRVSPWPSLPEWESILPRWFSDRCAPETSDAKAVATARRLEALPAEWRQVVRQNTAPSLGSWISCFEIHRAWLWWDAVVVSASDLEISHIVFELDAVHWSLSWLFVASGAWQVEASIGPHR